MKKRSPKKNTSQMTDTAVPDVKERSLKKMLFHSFVVIPFIIVVSCAVLFTAIQLLTREKQTAYDLLENVKMGGETKRWQSAFDLSKMLSQPGQVPEDEAFTREIISAFEKSKQDDNRVRQYLALAMGRTGRAVFFEPLTKDIANEGDETLSAVIYAVGMLRDKRGAALLNQFLDHPDSRIRSIAVVAIGTIANPASVRQLKTVLQDPEPNVRWGAAISLARMGNGAGKHIISKMLDREYLSSFAKVDPQEQNHLLLSAIEPASRLDGSGLREQLRLLSQTDQNIKIRAAALETLK